jgi:hypothetical protein
LIAASGRAFRRLAARTKMAAQWDAPTQQKFKEYTQVTLALVLGAVVLLPSIVSLAKPPFVLSWAIPLMLSLAALSVALLGLAMLAALLGSGAPPFKAMGAGTWSGLLALLLLLTYVIANLLVDEHRGRPVIVALKASPVGVSPGKYVELDVDAADEVGDRIAYQWPFAGKTFSRLRNAYWKAPATPGSYIVNVRALDTRGSADENVTIEVVAPTVEEHTIVNRCTEQSPPAPQSVGVDHGKSTNNHGQGNSRGNKSRARPDCPGQDGPQLGR